MRIKPIAAGAALATAGGIAFTSVVRPWYSRWGATDAEIDRPMPLDERIPDPTITTTMAITINTRPEAIWPWLVQIGDPPRAGYYSYTWIENWSLPRHRERRPNSARVPGSRSGPSPRPQRHDDRPGGRARAAPARARSAAVDRLHAVHLGLRALPDQRPLDPAGNTRPGQRQLPRHHAGNAGLLLAHLAAARPRRLHHGAEDAERNEAPGRIEPAHAG